MKVAYVAGPYRADTIYGVAQNIQKARDVALRLWKLGYAAICPHSNTAFFDGACDDSVWLSGDLEILRRCDFVVVLDGWEKSEGATKEVQIANINGIPVYPESWVEEQERKNRGGGYNIDLQSAIESKMKRICTGRGVEILSGSGDIGLI